MGYIKVTGPADVNWPQRRGGELPNPKKHAGGQEDGGEGKGGESVFEKVLGRRVTEEERKVVEDVVNNCSDVKDGDTSKLDDLARTLTNLPLEGNPCFDGVVCGAIVMNAGLDVLVDHKRIDQLGEERSGRMRELAGAVRQALGGLPGPGGLVDLQA